MIPTPPSHTAIWRRSQCRYRLLISLKVRGWRRNLLAYAEGAGVCGVHGKPRRKTRLCCSKFFITTIHPENRDSYKVYWVTTTPYILIQLVKAGTIRTAKPTAIWV